MFQQVDGTDVHLDEMEEVWIDGRLKDGRAMVGFVSFI